MKPPSYLDSAQVLYWAWSGKEPFGVMQDSSGNIAAEIYGFAICVLGGTIYRFSCDDKWEVQNDTDFPSVQDAMEALYPQYGTQTLHWNKLYDGDIDALLSESYS